MQLISHECTHSPRWCETLLTTLCLTDMAALFTRLYPTEDVHDGGTEEGLFTLIFCTFIHQVFIEYLSKAREG